MTEKLVNLSVRIVQRKVRWLLTNRLNMFRNY